MQRSWFVYIQGQTLGPLPTETVTLMLNQNRLQFADYIWASGQPTWQRIYEVDDFRKCLPAFPKDAPPTDDDAPPKAEKKKPTRKEVIEEEEAVAPLPKAAKEPAPKKEPPPKKEAAREFPKVRRNIRVPVSGKATLVGNGSFKILNVSEGGIYVKSAEPMAIGTDVKFKLEAEGLEKPLDMTGVVIRHNVGGEEAGFAIEFTRVNPAHKRALQAYVKDNGQGE